MIEITKVQLVSLNPCKLSERLKLFNNRNTCNAKQALESGVLISDILWVAGKLGLKHLCVQFALECAKRSAHNNTDPRVQAAINSAKIWLKDPTAENASAAEYAAEYAAESAEYATWAAARSAARSAAEAAEYATWAVQYAARSAAEAAEYATWAVQYAAWSTAGAAEKREQEKILIKIFS